MKWSEKELPLNLIFMCDNFSRSRSRQHPILKNCTSCFCPILNLFHRTGSKHRNSLDFFIFPGTGSVWQCWKAKSVLSTFPSVRDSAQAGQTKFQKIEKDKIPTKNSNKKCTHCIYFQQADMHYATCLWGLISSREIIMTWNWIYKHIIVGFESNISTASSENGFATSWGALFYIWKLLHWVVEHY